MEKMAEPPPQRLSLWKRGEVNPSQLLKIADAGQDTPEVSCAAPEQLGRANWNGLLLCHGDFGTELIGELSD